MVLIDLFFEKNPADHGSIGNSRANLSVLLIMLLLTLSDDVSRVRLNYLIVE